VPLNWIARFDLASSRLQSRGLHPGGHFGDIIIMYPKCWPNCSGVATDGSSRCACPAARQSPCALRAPAPGSNFRHHDQMLSGRIRATLPSLVAWRSPFACGRRSRTLRIATGFSVTGSQASLPSYNALIWQSLPPWGLLLSAGRKHSVETGSYEKKDSQTAEYPHVRSSGFHVAPISWSRKIGSRRHV